MGVKAMKCPHCNKAILLYDGVETKYCPYCGKDINTNPFLNNPFEDIFRDVLGGGDK